MKRYLASLMRQVYHTSLKELDHYELLPPKYLKTIPRTNVHRWKHDQMDRYVGSELNKIADKHTDLIKTLNHYPRMFYAYGSLVNTVVSIAKTTNDFSNKMRLSKKKVVKAIDQTKELVSVEKAVELFGISTSTFYTWVSDLEHSCTKSFFNKCNRIYSNQITPHEIRAVKKALLNPATIHWSIKSVFLKGLREGKITVSLHTIYRLNRVLGIRCPKMKKKFKKKRKVGIRASKPNQIWHTDITIVKTLDGVKHYAYLVIDNFSRKLLAYSIEDKVSGLTTVKTIEKAIKHAKEVSNDLLNVQLIVDGGPKNNNRKIDQFIKNSEVNIEKLVALRDIDYSNSMIESVNKIFRYSYLFPYPSDNKADLELNFPNHVYDFNDVRPHGPLNGLTPTEAFRGDRMPEGFRNKILKQARLDRLAFNRENQCQICNK
ncbi:MAG: DDE-type integrase/transposase/recombinase [Crocinitomicaceae bacterium]|nr:DDE-type integrase/transposase/recombinase [Crocinitomicaceae bacterium]